MPFNEVLDLAKQLLTERKCTAPLEMVEGLRAHGSLPESVEKRRSFGVDDDLATALVLADGMELVELRKRVRTGTGDLERHPRHLIAAWAMCETLRRLGFPNEAVAVSWGPVVSQGDDMLFVRVMSKGVAMIICISRHPAASAAEALSGWEELWADVVAAGEDDLTVLLARSFIGDYSKIVSLVAELARQGIEIPAAPGHQAPLTLLAGPIASLTRGGEA